MTLHADGLFSHIPPVQHTTRRRGGYTAVPEEPQFASSFSKSVNKVFHKQLAAREWLQPIGLKAHISMI